MAYNRIRDFYGPLDAFPRDAAAPSLPAPVEPPVTSRPTPTAPDMVNVVLSEVLPALTEAFGSRRFWIHDFLDDEISIPADLYQILLAYMQYRMKHE